MNELKNSLNALCCRYRDVDQMNGLVEAYTCKNKELAMANVFAMDMIFRICNTPDAKLLALLVKKRTCFIYRHIHE
jgi:hypothetical protein